jgi:hypothetical protein
MNAGKSVLWFSCICATPVESVWSALSLESQFNGVLEKRAALNDGVYPLMQITNLFPRGGYFEAGGWANMRRFGVLPALIDRYYVALPSWLRSLGI